MILKIISHSDVKHIMTFLVKTIMSLLNVSTYIITIAALFIQMIMSVSTLVTAVILYLLKQQIVIVFNISLNYFSVLNLIYIFIVSEVAEKVIWNAVVDDPVLFLRHFLEKLTVKEKMEELLFLLRKLILHFQDLPAQMAHSLFNYLV